MLCAGLRGYENHIDDCDRCARSGRCRAARVQVQRSALFMRAVIGCYCFADAFAFAVLFVSPCPPFHRRLLFRF